VWQHVKVPLTGAVLAPGPRTVTAILVAYIPQTPLWVQGPATAGGGATARQGAGRHIESITGICPEERCMGVKVRQKGGKWYVFINHHSHC
jgi:hypothetical protein